MYRFPPVGSVQAQASGVPFYRDGIPDVITKEEIRHRHEELVHPSQRERNLELSSTSGSTGIPLRYYEADRDREACQVCYNRPYLLLPYDSYQAVSLNDFERSDALDEERYKISFRSARFERKVAQYFKFFSTRESCDTLADWIWEDRPGLLEGYPSAIYLVARLYAQEGTTLESVKVISPCGEYFPEEYREVMQEAFPRAVIHARYGLMELGPVAWECPLCYRYHLNADHYALRALPDDRVALSKRFPSGCQLINYDSGDRLRLVAHGDCEVDLPTIEILEGRRDDILLDRAGRPLPIMPYHLGDIPGLIQWQIVQEADHSLVFKAIVEEATPELEEKLRRQVQEDLQEDTLPLEIRFVRQLDGARKLKRVISKVSHRELVLGDGPPRRSTDNLLVLDETPLG